MSRHTKKQIRILLKAAVIMFLGIYLFKLIPMQIWGDYLLFDASAHIIITSFFLYMMWFFVDQNTTWRIPFFIFSILVLAIVSFQRISINAHNDIGLLAGLIVSISAILYSQFDKFKERLNF